MSGMGIFAGKAFREQDGQRVLSGADHLKKPTFRLSSTGGDVCRRKPVKLRFAAFAKGDPTDDVFIAGSWCLHRVSYQPELQLKSNSQRRSWRQIAASRSAPGFHFYPDTVQRQIGFVQHTPGWLRRHMHHQTAPAVPRLQSAQHIAVCWQSLSVGRNIRHRRFDLVQHKN